MYKSCLYHLIMCMSPKSVAGTLHAGNNLTHYDHDGFFNHLDGHPVASSSPEDIMYLVP